MDPDLLSQCEIIEQNCTYSAEAHHLIAACQRRRYTFFQLGPAVASALLGTLAVGAVVPPWVGTLGLVTAVITAIGTVLNPQREYLEHLSAAKAFTAMKHEGRVLRAATVAVVPAMPPEQAILTFCARYSDLIRAVPPTEDWAFNKAQENIKQGVHTPDELKS